MVLQFLRNFGESFDLKDEFPDGISLGESVCSAAVKPVMFVMRVQL